MARIDYASSNCMRAKEVFMKNHREGVLFVAGCAQRPIFQAGKLDSAKIKWTVDLDVLLHQYDAVPIPMPCPEVSFPSCLTGLNRKPHGIKFYSELPGFAEHCQQLSKQVVQQIAFLHHAGTPILGIIGVEHSPTCAATYMYTNCGLQHRKGLLFQCIEDRLTEEGLDIKFLGVNRGSPGASFKRIESHLKKD